MKIRRKLTGKVVWGYDGERRRDGDVKNSRK